MATEAHALLEKLDRISEVEAAQKEPLPRPFGSYVLLSSLAKGGMGEVFLAKSGAVAGFEKHCVVKTLRPHLTDDREYVARFIDEARVVVQLNHKSVCQVFDVGMVGERYYLAMELIAGQDLRTLADASVDVSSGAGGEPVRPFDPALAVHITGEVLEALDYAHRFVDVSGAPLHLVHRDVSPQNVMLSFEGEVKLIDFGLAASTVKLEQTSPNVVMGKLAYMAPEQIRGEKVDGRADLFACAVMLTELCTGERYYAGKTSYEIWSIASSGTFRPRRFETVPADLRRILDRALSPEPGLRHASCLLLRQDLMEWRQQQGLYTDGPMLRSVMQSLFADDIREHRELLAGVAAATLRPSARPAEPTRSFARAGTAPTPVLGVDAAADDPPTNTGALVRDLRDRRRRPLLVGLALLSALVGFVVWRGIAGSAEADPVDEAAVEVVARGPSRVVADPPAAVVEAAPVVAVTPPPPLVKAKAPERVEKAPKVSPPKVVAPVVNGASWSDMGIPEKVATLARSCSKLACVEDVQRRFPSWGVGSPSDMKQFRSDVDACHERCK